MLGFLRDPVWLLTAVAGVVLFLVPLAAQRRQLSRHMSRNQQILMQSHLLFLCCVILAGMYTGIFGTAALLAVWGALTWVTPPVVRTLARWGR